MGCKAIGQILVEKLPDSSRSAEECISPLLQGLHWLIPSLVTDEGSAKAHAYIEALCPEQEKHLIRRSVEGKASLEDVCSWIDQRGFATSLLEEHRETVKSILTFLGADEVQQKGVLEHIGKQEGVEHVSGKFSLVEPLIQTLTQNLSHEHLEVIHALTQRVLGKDDKVEALFRVLEERSSKTHSQPIPRSEDSFKKKVERSWSLLSQHSWITRLHIIACGLLWWVLSFRGVHHVVRNGLHRRLIHHLDVLMRRSCRSLSQEEIQAGREWMHGFAYFALQALGKRPKVYSFSSKEEFDVFLRVHNFDSEAFVQQLQRSCLHEEEEALWKTSWARHDLLPGAIEIKSGDIHILLAPQGKGLSLLMPHEGPLIEHCMRSMGRNQEGALLDRFLSSCWVGNEGIHSYHMDHGRPVGRSYLCEEYLSIAHFLQSGVPLPDVTLSGRYAPLIAGAILLKGGAGEKPRKGWLSQGLQVMREASRDGILNGVEEMWVSVAALRTAMLHQPWGLEGQHQQLLQLLIQGQVEKIQRGSSWIQKLPEDCRNVIGTFLGGTTEKIEQHLNSFTDERFPEREVHGDQSDWKDLLRDALCCVRDLIVGETKDIFEQVTSCQLYSPPEVGSLRGDLHLLLGSTVSAVAVSYLGHRTQHEQGVNWQDNLFSLANGIPSTDDFNINVVKNSLLMLCVPESAAKSHRKYRKIIEKHKSLASRWKESTRTPEEVSKNHLAAIVLVVTGGIAIFNLVPPHPHGRVGKRHEASLCNLSSIGSSLISTIPRHYIPLDRERSGFFAFMFEKLGEVLPYQPLYKKAHIAWEARTAQSEVWQDAYEAASDWDSEGTEAISDESTEFQSLHEESFEGMKHLRDAWGMPLLHLMRTDPSTRKVILEEIGERKYSTGCGQPWIQSWIQFVVRFFHLRGALVKLPVHEHTLAASGLRFMDYGLRASGRTTLHLSNTWGRTWGRAISTVKGLLNPIQK